MHSLYKKMIVTVHGVFVEKKYNNCVATKIIKYTEG